MNTIKELKQELENIDKNYVDVTNKLQDLLDIEKNIINEKIENLEKEIELIEWLKNEAKPYILLVGRNQVDYKGTMFFESLEKANEQLFELALEEYESYSDLPDWDACKEDVLSDSENLNEQELEIETQTKYNESVEDYIIMKLIPLDFDSRECQNYMCEIMFDRDFMENWCKLLPEIKNPNY
jgi:DNA repair exonuclease SbcCD ATPase subunit